jgi:hypothetical protein
VIANNQQLAEQLDLLPIDYHITHRDDPYDPAFPWEHPHNCDEHHIVNATGDPGQDPFQVVPFDIFSPYKGKIVKVADDRTPGQQDGTINLKIALYVGKDSLARNIYFESVHNNVVLVEEDQIVEPGEKIGQLNIVYNTGGGGAYQITAQFGFLHTKGWDISWEDYPYYVDAKPTFLDMFLGHFVIQRDQAALIVYSGPEHQQLTEQIPPEDRSLKIKTALHERIFLELARSGYSINEIDEYHGSIVSPEEQVVPYDYFDYRALYLNPPE